MMSLTLNSILPWHQPVWSLLQGYIHSKRIPHALMIYGNNGLGKNHLARQLSKALLCEQNINEGLACDNCRSCRLFSAQTHPDFFSVNPLEAGKDISINQIRKLITDLSLKPQFEQYRTVIINPAEQMNRASANGLLKCLEEPPERTLILLISERPFLLPATIKSRCQKLHLTAPDPITAENWLQSQHFESQDRITLLNLAQGAPLLAMQFDEQGILALRKEYFSVWLDIARHKIMPISVAEQCSKQTDAELISWMTSWVIDLIKIRFDDKRATLFNPDLKQPLQELSQQLKLEQLFSYYDFLLKSRQRLTTQLNKQLIFEEVLIKWSNLNLTA